jgi:hypothetical protein
LTPVPDRADEYELDVARELKDHSPTCTKCGARLRAKGRFCSQCGADAPVVQEKWSAAELRAAVQELADERELDIRDEIRTAHGRLYFATHRRSGVLQTLQLDETESGDYALAVTDLLQRILAETTAVPSSPSPPN